MRSLRLHLKKITICVVFLIQIILALYCVLQKDGRKFEKRSKISFIKAINSATTNLVTYHTIPNDIQLTDIATSDLYIDFNSSLCFKNGTDISRMHGSQPNWKCKCLPGWHGKDCGQPEIIWRALLTYRKPVQLRGPRKNQRRIIYLLAADQVSLINTEIIIKELSLIVDLFILYKFSTYLNPNLNHKILYLQVPDMKYALMNLKSISNIQSDDIIFRGDVNEIPNSLALLFLKLYDGWPQPLQFRYRWNVYGFFWMHPVKTIVRSSAHTLSFMYESNTNKPLIIGDLNHFGGWFCQFCYESNNILNVIKDNPDVIKLNDRSNIDNSYIEDLIENGIYLDGKTELIRTRSYFSYYAPSYIVNNSWKYDWLFINLYSKLDYD